MRKTFFRIGYSRLIRLERTVLMRIKAELGGVDNSLCTVRHREGEWGMRPSNNRRVVTDGTLVSTDVMSNKLKHYRNMGFLVGVTYNCGYFLRSYNRQQWRQD